MYENIIYRRENYSYAESSSIERVPGKRNWLTPEEHKEKFEEKERISEQMRIQTEKNEQFEKDYQAWLEYQKEIHSDNIPNYNK